MNISQAEILFGELKEIVECPEAYSMKDFSDRMYELMEVFKKNPEQIDDITYIIEKERTDDGFCPKCGIALKVKDHWEDRGEYQGFDCQETIYESYCENCGWSEND